MPCSIPGPAIERCLKTEGSLGETAMKLRRRPQRDLMAYGRCRRFFSLAHAKVSAAAASLPEAGGNPARLQ